MAKGSRIAEIVLGFPPQKHFKISISKTLAKSLAQDDFLEINRNLTHNKDLIRGVLNLSENRFL